MGTEDLTTLKKEAIDAVEEIKGHSRYDELKTKVDKDGATKEELNSAKTSATEILNKYKKEVEASTLKQLKIKLLSSLKNQN
ncbi:hypothetical protein ONA00_04310 [Mycoplasmopsis cynos]|uniref:hypothetical protein n=1 Tax=Mycoplasmopsis cynos TaxID=171284 RepID=UPI0024CC20A1|nr:hypothetical protein [Mycoplasmopsis cynos]WAM10570.1 hypothetical protein ONA00_04310 [Mycoplasmopsis cynos]